MKKRFTLIALFVFGLRTLSIGQNIDIDLLEYSTDDLTYFFGEYHKPYWSACHTGDSIFTGDTLVFTANAQRCEDAFMLLFKRRRIVEILGESSKYKGAKIIYSKRSGCTRRAKFYRRKQHWYLQLAAEKKKSRVYILVELSQKSLGISEVTGTERFFYKMVFVDAGSR